MALKNKTQKNTQFLMAKVAIHVQVVCYFQAGRETVFLSAFLIHPRRHSWLNPCPKLRGTTGKKEKVYQASSYHLFWPSCCSHFLRLVKLDHFTQAIIQVYL